MGFLRNVVAAFKPSNIARGLDAARNPPQISDPAQRARVAAEELAAREAARAPYRAAELPPVVFTRIAARGETQLAELLDHLRDSGLAAAPERVYGVSRVPDRISPALTPHSERGRVVEWEIVHDGVASGLAGAAPAAPSAAPTAPTAPAAPSAARPVATSFRGAERWVGRRLGEPSVLDEELALAFCLEAGIGPERCLGLARISEFRALKGGDEHEELRTLVEGVVAVHGPDDGRGAWERMRDAAPLALDHELAARAGVHVELIDWEEIARVVQPKIHHPPSVPSPFPYLPSTPGELLRSYLEIVGVQPFDCWSAQATVDRARALMQGGLFTTNLGPKQPCADGEARMRTRGCELLTIVYRDRPDYAAGRERWAAYEREVLQARLGSGLRGRRALALPENGLDGIPKLLRPAVRVAAAIDALTDWEWGTEQRAPYRYCWPPLDAPTA